jgi:hypothetical protein
MAPVDNNGSCGSSVPVQDNPRSRHPSLYKALALFTAARAFFRLTMSQPNTLLRSFVNADLRHALDSVTTS